MSSDLLSQKEKDEFKTSHDKFIKELNLLKEKPFFSEDNEEIKNFLLRATTLRLMKQQQRKKSLI